MLDSIDEALVKEAYVTLLRMPIGEVRTLCQPVLASLRRVLAAIADEPEDEVQKFYEKLARDINNL